MFDLSKAIKDGANVLKNQSVGAIILGPSGAGKSTLLGSFGVKTLYLHTTGEAHGAKAASTNGSDIIPVCIDYSEGKQLTPDEAYTRLSTILDSADQISSAKIGAIVLDGATELEALVRSTKRWEALCKTKDGKHNTFAETPATCTMIREVIQKLIKLQRDLTVHYAVSCILDVKELGEDGDIMEASPRLQGYAVAETLIQMFPDVLVVGRMSRDGTAKHKIQFMSDMKKVSKDAKGQVKKMINFTPRLTGIPVSNLPDYMDASFEDVIKFKKDNVK